ncbi:MULTISPECIES: SH3 domain-containing protein [Prauserella salsuginis group]|uniref:Uncharacterized protein YgiM (DUF1202 family) n=2 Tax=Prauserella salsuginis group TaxID=2893672 RepID=A0A839XQ11_9PSEU|nr:MULTISPECIES: SH3 domain-containing protein [Prauserella salsuginis group]MBB3662016.1 uncharacterized protein YgiM (DUF1202 family) [Prauserella sediminis]MCR3719713.1 hypothetical protein [Prauserella flava]MCR3736744.1 hypothetical protein [Prauserella salsuginis]
MILGIPKRTLLILVALIAVIVLYAMTGGELSSEAEGSDGDGGCSMTVEADALNVRSGPSTGDEIVDKLEQDAETDATTEVRDGFRKLADGEWAADDFLEPADGASC